MIRIAFPPALLDLLEARYPNQPRLRFGLRSDDPDALAAEYEARGATFPEPLADTDDGLRGFGVRDADGYVIFFGRAIG